MKNFRLILLLFFTLFVNSCNKHAPNPVSPDASDVWKVSPPEAQLVNSTKLNFLSDEIEKGTYGEIKSLIIARNNFLIFEHYYRGDSREDLHLLYSVTKSFTSALVGIAINEGKIAGLIKTLLGYFPEYTVQNNSLTKQSINLKDAITMSAGFQWNELSLPYSDVNNDFQVFYRSKDKFQYILNKPIEYEPGTKFVYNTALTYLFSGIIKKQMRESAEQMAVEKIFNPLGIGKYIWETTADSISNTGNGLSLRPIDMALFGQLYLDKGKWNNQQLIPQSWIQESTAKSISVNSYYDYGYFWWRFSNSNSVVSSLPVNDIYYAEGYSDQFIFVVPQYQMVIVITADNREDYYPIGDMLKNYIFPAIIN
ncbi:MAG TPA: serine hydrolase [Ignavibacteriaceae bacterium]|nr:serine hydrolase [Ignavibacteriaceae bacterium]